MNSNAFQIVRFYDLFLSPELDNIQFEKLIDCLLLCFKACRRQIERSMISYHYYYQSIFLLTSFNSTSRVKTVDIDSYLRDSAVDLAYQVNVNQANHDRHATNVRNWPH